MLQRTFFIDAIKNAIENLIDSDNDAIWGNIKDSNMIAIDTIKDAFEDNIDDALNGAMEDAIEYTINKAIEKTYENAIKVVLFLLF